MTTISDSLKVSNSHFMLFAPFFKSQKWNVLENIKETIDGIKFDANTEKFIMKCTVNKGKPSEHFSAILADNYDGVISPAILIPNEKVDDVIAVLANNGEIGQDYIEDIMEL